MTKCSYLLAGTGMVFLLLPAPVRAVEETSFHKVTEETPSLCTVGIYLYGSCRKAADIAAWNEIANPNRIRLGQKLKLKEPPRLTAEQGSAALLTAFRKGFGIKQALAAPEKIEETVEAKVAAAEDPVKKEESEFTKLEALAKVPPRALTIEEADHSSAAGPAPTPVALVAVVRERAIEDNFDKGKKFFENKKYEEALDVFQLNRKNNPKFLPAWIFEIRTLQALKRDPEAQTAAREMIVLHPQTRFMPLVKPYLDNGGEK